MSRCKCTSRDSRGGNGLVEDISFSLKNISSLPQRSILPQIKSYTEVYKISFYVSNVTSGGILKSDRPSVKIVFQQ